MTDLRKLLSEARAAIESLEAIIEGEISRDWSDIFYADWLIADKAKSRIDAELAEKVEPVAEVISWTNGSYSRNYRIKWLRDVDEGTKLYAAPADQWRRVEDGLPHTDHPMRHYDRTCPACNTALPEGE